MITARIYEWARVHPDKAAIIQDGRAYSYAAFARAIDATSQFLAAQGLPGAGIAVVLARDLLASWLIILGARNLGLDTVSVASPAAARKLELHDVACIITTPIDAFAHGLDAGSAPSARIVSVPDLPEANIDSGALPSRPDDGRRFGGHILYTAGTTGAGRKVLLDGANDDARIAEFARILRLDANSVYHGGAFGHWTSAGFKVPPAVWSLGGSVVVDLRADSLARIFDHRPTIVSLLPDGIKQLVDRLPTLRARTSRTELVTGAGFVPLPVVDKLLLQPQLGLVVVYGLMEAGPVMSSRIAARDDVLWLSPDPARTIEIVDQAGMPCNVGEEGLLRVRTTAIDAQQYLGDPESTAQTFKDGFFYPGDIAMRREDGRIRILGRMADVLNFQGHKLAIAPLEQRLQERLGVDEVCLFAGAGQEGIDEIIVAIRADRDPPRTQLDQVAYDFRGFERVRFAVLKEFPRTEADAAKTKRSALRQLVIDQARAIR